MTGWARVPAFSPMTSVTGSAIAAADFWRAMKFSGREEIWLLVLGDDYRRRNFVRLAEGGEFGVLLDQDRLFSEVRRARCRSYVVGHCHPSGDPRPSLDDWTTTANLLRWSDEAGLDCVDHVIVARNPSGGGRYASLRELNESLFLQYER